MSDRGRIAMVAKDLIGQRLGNYHIESVLGVGGVGAVFRATHVHLNRPVAIKVLHPFYAADPMFQARFLQEARAAAALNHPNIIAVSDFGQHDGWFYLVMALARDGSVRTLIQQSGAGQPLPLGLGLDLVRQAAEALAYAHETGMVHRDIKPDNLLLDRSDAGASQELYTVKVSDFGLARLAEGGVSTATGVTMGTPAYMSPEQSQGIDLDGRADLYSLGVVCYELATGQPPFEIKTLSDAVFKHVYLHPPPPRQIRPDLSLDVEETILRCLAKQPEDRYRSARDLVAAVRAVLQRVSPDTLAITSRPPVGTQAGSTLAPSASAPHYGSVPPAFGDATVPARAPIGQAAPRVHVLDQQGHIRAVHELTSAGFKIGRLPDNDVVLDDSTVSHHHLRINWDGHRVHVTNLGASPETQLGGKPLSPGSTHMWRPQDDLRVGAFRLTLEPWDRGVTEPAVALPTPHGATGSASSAARSPQLWVEPAGLMITPGQPATVTVMLPTPEVALDSLTVTVEGVPESWVQRPDSTIQADAERGGRGRIIMTVDVPAWPENCAGEYPVTIRVRSRVRPIEWTAQALWILLPFAESTLTLTPARASGVTGARYRVELEHRGNAVARYGLAGDDDQGRLRCQLEQESITLDPGESAMIGVSVQAPRRWIGRSALQSISVYARTPASASHQSVTGTFLHRPVLPIWLLVLLPTLILVAAFIVLLARG